MRLALLLLLCLPLLSQDRMWQASIVAYGGAQAADIASSWGRLEVNPWMRGPDGRAGTRGVAIKAAISGAIILSQWLVLRKHPSAGRSLAFTNFALAGGVGAVAARNWSTR